MEVRTVNTGDETLHLRLTPYCMVVAAILRRGFFNIVDCSAAFARERLRLNSRHNKGTNAAIFISLLTHDECG